MTILDRFMVALGFKIEAEGLQGFAKHAEQAKTMALGLAGAISGAVIGIERMVRSTAGRMDAVGDFAEQMGMSAREVAALGKVASVHESSIEGMQNALRTMTGMAGQASMGVGRGAKLFKAFGINVKDSSGHTKEAGQLLGDVAEKMKGLSSHAEKMALGGRLGFDPQLILLLSKGREELFRLRDEAARDNPFTEDDYEAADQTEKAYARAERSVTRLKDRLSVGLFPTVQRVLDRFVAWTKDENNIKKIQRAINGVVTVAEALWKHANKFIYAFAILKAHKYGMMFMEWGAKLGTFIKGLSNGAAAVELLTKGLVLMKGVLLGGLVAAVALIVEDLMTFERGGRSLTGWMVDTFPAGIEVMKLALAGFSTAALALMTKSGGLAVIIVGFVAWAVAIRSIQKNWDILVTSMKQGLNDIGNHWVFKSMDKLQKFLGSGGGGMIGMSGGATTIDQGVKDYENSWWAKNPTADEKKRRASSGGSIPADYFAPGAGVMAPAGPAPFAWRMDQPASEITNNTVVFHSTATDAPGVRREVDEFMRRWEAQAKRDAETKNRGATRDAQAGHR